MFSSNKYRYRALPSNERDVGSMASLPPFENKRESERDITRGATAPDNTENEVVEADDGKRGIVSEASEGGGGKVPWWSRNRYFGALLFNVCSFILPALYGTLAKLWIANIDSKMVVTTDAYTYISVVTEVINEGLPRAVFLVIGDKSSRTLKSRLRLSFSLILFQIALGALMSIIICACAETFASAFVPIDVRDESIRYVRISSFQSVFSALDVAVSSSTRALDRPDVPLVISSVKTAINIILDVVFLSKFRPTNVDVDVNTQAIIRLCCDAAGALAGTAFFLYTAAKLLGPRLRTEIHSVKPSFMALKTLGWPAGLYYFVESAIRNALYLWLVSGIVDMGLNYATAWGIFNTIRWGLVMVPVQSLEATASTFVGHNWGQWRAQTGRETRKPKALRRDLINITRPALSSAGLALLVEVPLAILMSFKGAKSFAYYLSGSEEVADITAYMWRSIDWCYIFYALSTQLATILLATRPRWYLGQSLGSNIFWVLPWAIAVTRIDMTPDTAWKWHSIVFGGSLVVSFAIILVVVGIWGWRLLGGKSKLPVVVVNV